MVCRTPQRGFTLIEMVMVIVILGVVGSMVAVFMKGPIDAYFASARRAGLTDVADTVVRRMARDIHKALPNSLRTPGTQCVEFIPTKTGGRYRVHEVAAGDGKNLDFSTVDTTFHMLGSNAALPVNQRMVANDVVVVYNLGISGADAYANPSENTATISSLGTPTAVPIETPIVLNPGKQFPLASGSGRFHVVSGTEQVVGYVCSGAGTSAAGNGTGVLRRYVNTLPYAAPASCPTPAASDPIVATQVSACNFDYTGSDLQRNALIRMTLQITDSGETVSLQHEVHVNNTP